MATWCRLRNCSVTTALEISLCDGFRGMPLATNNHQGGNEDGSLLVQMRYVFTYRPVLIWCSILRRAVFLLKIARGKTDPNKMKHTPFQVHDKIHWYPAPPVLVVNLAARWCHLHYWLQILLQSSTASWKAFYCSNFLHALSSLIGIGSVSNEDIKPIKQGVSLSTLLLNTFCNALHIIPNGCDLVSSSSRVTSVKSQPH